MEIKNYTPYLLLSFLAGVALRSFFSVPQNWLLAGIGLVAGFLVALVASSKFSLIPSPYEGEGKKKEIKSLSFGVRFLLMIFCLFLGMLRFSFFENNITEDQLHNHYGEVLNLQGKVILSEQKPQSERLILETDLGRTLVIKKIYPQYKYGDVLAVHGELVEPENYGNFDVKKYLAKDRVYSQMLFPEIQKMHESNNVFILLLSIKDQFEQSLKNILPEPHASLADGMLLGNEGVLDENLKEAFQKTSTIHILVLSGYNITVVGTFIMAGLSFLLPPAGAWAGSILGILAFTLMTGAEPAAIRAAIMAIIGLLALRAGRLRFTMLALFWAAFFMLLWNPMYLRFDRSFQLSFLAALGLILFAGFFQRVLSFLPKFLGLRESAASSFAAQIFVFPLLISWGNQISFLSPLANILIVGVVPIIMFFSFFGALFGFVSTIFGQAVASVAYVIISYQIFIAEFLAGLQI